MGSSSIPLFCNLFEECVKLYHDLAHSAVRMVSILLHDCFVQQHQIEYPRFLTFIKNQIETIVDELGNELQQAVQFWIHAESHPFTVNPGLIQTIRQSRAKPFLDEVDKSIQQNSGYFSSLKDKMEKINTDQTVDDHLTTELI